MQAFMLVGGVPLGLGAARSEGPAATPTGSDRTGGNDATCGRPGLDTQSGKDAHDRHPRGAGGKLREP